jgi:hypothetical protein
MQSLARAKQFTIQFTLPLQSIEGMDCEAHRDYCGSCYRARGQSFHIVEILLGHSHTYDRKGQQPL